MRILQVRFKNLNSLEGEWQIDLTHPSFTSESIFAITGPTGAGKSTILDAICLALYGRTPRLEKVTKSSNEIMSRQAEDCFAEVVFETDNGRFRCHWSQRRSRGKAKNDWQPAKHELANADSGVILEAQIRKVAAAIEAATGMDYYRFTRSMLLAQGQFAAFLQASPDDRAPILEQITGTEIYSDISIRVHERQRDERQKLLVLQAETAGIQLLEPSQEQELRQRLEAQEAKEKEHARNVADTKKAMEWLEDIDRLRKEIAELAGESERLQGELEAFVPEREKLNQAQKAASLDGLYAQLTTTRKQQTEEEIDLEAHTGKVAGLQSLVTERAEALKNAAQQSLLAKQALKEAGPQLQEVRALDQRLAEQRKMAAEEQKACDKAAATLQAHEKAHGSEQIKRENTGKVLQLASSYLETHAQDEWLVGGLAGVEEQVKGLVDKQKEIARKQGEQVKATAVRDKAAKTVAEREKQSVLRRQSWQQATQKRNEGKEAWEQLLGGRSLREYRAEQETLLRKMAFFSRVAELQEHRARLQDGEPCPLCGAAEHPYAKGNVPVPDETEKKLESLRLLIEKAEEQEALVRKLEEAETRARDKLAEAEKLEILAANDKTTAENALKTVVDALAEWQGDYARRKQTVFDTLLGLGIEPAQDADMALVLEPLRVRLASWQTHSKKKGEAEKQLAVIDTEMSRLRALLESQNAVLADKKERLEQVRQTIAVESEKRKALYGDKKPEEEEARLYEAVTAREMEETRAREQHQEAHERLIATQTQIESLRTSREKRAPVLQRLQEEYSQAVETAGFSSEEQYLQALLSHEQREQLAFRAKQLDEREVELKTRKAERHASLDKELVRSLTDQSLEALLPIYKKGEEELEAVRGDIAEIKIKLHDQEVAKERIKEKQQAIEAQGKECGRWDALSKLIGSADGKKFRNFAQGLTLEVMLHHANHQLRTMTDRYLLKRDDATSLQFNVVDDYQGGEIRSTKNLSGGESFLVSLALALGLSQMVSQNVRVDSLFLDEGFGSLDEDALDSALTTLSGLQHEGKLIGVISHVPALKARVGVQIEVTPKTGGRSSISGPGCRRLDNELTPRKPGKRS